MLHCSLSLDTSGSLLPFSNCDPCRPLTLDVSAPPVRLQREVQQGLYDAVLHVGDFAYDMDSDNAEVGDAFMRQLQPIAGYLPYMTCPGNHEQR